MISYCSKNCLFQLLAVKWMVELWKRPGSFAKVTRLVQYWMGNGKPLFEVQQVGNLTNSNFYSRSVFCIFCSYISKIQLLSVEVTS